MKKVFIIGLLALGMLHQMHGENILKATVYNFSTEAVVVQKSSGEQDEQLEGNGITTVSAFFKPYEQNNSDQICTLTLNKGSDSIGSVKVFLKKENYSSKSKITLYCIAQYRVGKGEDPKDPKDTYDDFVDSNDIYQSFKVLHEETYETQVPFAVKCEITLNPSSDNPLDVEFTEIQFTDTQEDENDNSNSNGNEDKSIYLSTITGEDENISTFENASTYPISTSPSLDPSRSWWLEKKKS